MATNDYATHGDPWVYLQALFFGDGGCGGANHIAKPLIRIGPKTDDGESLDECMIGDQIRFFGHLMVSKFQAIGRLFSTALMPDPVQQCGSMNDNLACQNDKRLWPFGGRLAQ